MPLVFVQWRRCRPRWPLVLGLATPLLIALLAIYLAEWLQRGAFVGLPYCLLEQLRTSTAATGAAAATAAALAAEGTSAAASPPPQLELVIAHHSENLSWVDPFVSELGAPGLRLTVYSKGGPPPLPQTAVQLPNVGREGHTFLHHLHLRYYRLAEVTLFVMASAAVDSEKQQFLQELQAGWHGALTAGFFCSGVDTARPKPDFQIEQWSGTTDGGGQDLRPAKERPFGFWYSENIGGPLPRAWCPKAFMAVHRERVRQRPRAFYKHLLRQLSHSKDPEAGHFLERSWASIFYLPAALPACYARC